MAGLITAEYTCLDCRNEAPHVEAVGCTRAPIWALAFCCTLLQWADHLSFGSTQIPRMCTSCVGAFPPSPSWIPACRLNPLLLVKWISLYFFGANLIPCLLAHCMSFSWTCSSFLQFISVDLE